MSRFYYIFALYLIVVLILGCAHNLPSSRISSDNENIVIVENVPFVKQKDKFCGPASMASVLQFYGQDIDQSEIAEVIYIPELNGALISDMENYARDNGYNVESTNGSIDILKSKLDESQPVILLVDKGKWRVSVPHYYVAYGYNDERKTIILHTGDKGDQEISYDKLDEEWAKMNKLMLVITP
ncbi:MAG: peptidase C39 [Thermodesulfobacteriota bacterium]|nr:MAG: peptidase C39 [Thermodesulfobacteriota bacterium]